MLIISRSTTRRASWLPFAQTGFTLVELMVTIAIASVLLMVAVPGIRDFQRNAQLSEAASNIVSAANAARANAMKLGFNTYVVPVTGTSWSTGWIVFSDSNWNQVYNAGVDEVVLRHEAIDANVTITVPTASSLTDGYLLFNGSGYPRLKAGGFGGGTLVMSNGLRSSSIIVDPAGRVRSCKTGDTGC